MLTGPNVDAREIRNQRRQLGALSRPAVEFTRQSLADHPDLVALLEAVLASTPLPKPPDAAPSEPDYLVVGLSPAQIDAVVAALTTREGSRAAARHDEVHLSFAPTLADVWSQLQQRPARGRDSR